MGGGGGEQWITSPTVLMHFFTTIAIGESITATQCIAHVCSNLTKFNCGLQWRRNALFAMCFFYLLFLFLNIHCSISSGISLRAVNTNFYGCYCAIFMVAIVQSANSIIRRINVVRLMEQN